MRVIGLTGPTGAGKGEVARRLAAEGACVVDTDRLARVVVEPGTPCLQAIVDTFGDDMLKADGTLDRRRLAAVVYADSEAQARLNAITHPAIMALSVDTLKASDAPYGVIDAPLLFESGMDALCDVTVAVLAPKEVRLSRIMARDGIDEAHALARIQAQPNDAFYADRVTHMVENTGDLEALDRALAPLLQTIREGTL